ncbi:RING/U-box superfamily protein [Heracleum sosnowskyi]|uniref:RING/U-box superfamily protein n=1 Tax=Heracleum sosnowskyi TaxID=360622 RepID=A0AAD8IRG8_9APIA|nr:RING/U-box superfamily protein [Heracleum sosnowskyi]
MRFLCAQCKVGWHTGIDCEEFGKLNKSEEEKEDLVLHQLAKRNGWKQCPRCKIYIQLGFGCHTMHCSCCGCCFCYGCGVAYGDPSGHDPDSRRCYRAFNKRARKS